MATMTVTKSEIKTIQKELDMMEVKVMRLKARLVPTEKLTDKECKELEAAKKRIAKGERANFDDMTANVG
jgi:uncharacterized coiled-coil DUF342 family protein